MAKTFFSSLLFCTLFLSFTGKFFANETKKTDFNTLEAMVCNAPPPDSFRVTSIGSTFISLAWHPVSAGTTYRLIVSVNDGAIGWSPIDTINSAPGSSITLNGLDLNVSHQVSISTNCSEGDPSALLAFIDDINLIVDLTLAGRVPKNPVSVPCDNIPINSPWKGFRITYNTPGMSQSSLFEVVAFQETAPNNNIFSHAVIKRIGAYNTIVAADEFDNWPNNNDPYLDDVEKPFRMIRLLGNGPVHEKIGRVEFSSNFSSIKLCPSLDHPWNGNYELIALVAENAYEHIEPSTIDNRYSKKLILDNKIRVQNPFNGYLNVFLPETYSNIGKITFRLFDFNGRHVMEQQINVFATQISFPVEHLTAGIYSLCIETEGSIQYLKVIISE